MKTRNSSFKIIVLGLFISAVAAGCSSNDKMMQPSKLVLTSETSDFGGSQLRTNYEYDASGNLSKMSSVNAAGDVVSTLQFHYNEIVDNTFNNSARTSYNTDISRSLPTKADVYRFDNGIPVGVYYSYSFEYDGASRLTTIAEQTERVKNDVEWTLKVSYDNNSNVSSMTFLATAPEKSDDVPFTNKANVPITVTAYDSHPTPYASLKNWKFLMFSSSIKNSDPEPVLTALSTNNPLNYTFHADDVFSERTMTYTYDANGFPATRFNATKSELGQSSFTQTFSYARLMMSSSAE
jgi:hypothetical protein